MFNLNKNYIEKTLNFSNPLILQLIDEYKRGFDGGRIVKKPTPLCASRCVFDDFFEEWKTIIINNITKKTIERQTK